MYEGWPPFPVGSRQLHDGPLYSCIYRSWHFLPPFMGLLPLVAAGLWLLAAGRLASLALYRMRHKAAGGSTLEAITERAAYSLEQTRYKLGDISRDTVERLIAKGDLKSFKVGSRRFISAVELQRFIRERETEAES